MKRVFCLLLAVSLFCSPAALEKVKGKRLLPKIPRLRPPRWEKGIPVSFRVFATIAGCTSDDWKDCQHH